MADSRRYVGNNPIPLPWLWGPADSGGSSEPDKPFGHWFSTPRESECLVGTPFGTVPPRCTWQQKPQAWVMFTKDLIALGYDGNTVNMVRENPAPMYVVPASVTPLLCCCGYLLLLYCALRCLSVLPIPGW
jgi:hypothetical protein